MSVVGITCEFGWFALVFTSCIPVRAPEAVSTGMRERTDKLSTPFFDLTICSGRNQRFRN